MDLEFFDPAAGLALFDNDQTVYVSLLHSFSDTLEELAARIGTLTAQHQRPELIRLCHNIRSTAGQMGGHVVHLKAQALEQCLKSTTGPLTVSELASLADWAGDLLRLKQLADEYLTAWPPVASDLKTTSNEPNRR